VSSAASPERGARHRAPFRLDVPPATTRATPRRSSSRSTATARTATSRERTVGARDDGERHGVFVAHPNAPRRSNRRFWNATDACCNFDPDKIDDVAYLTAVIDDVAARYRIDPKRCGSRGSRTAGSWRTAWRATAREDRRDREPRRVDLDRPFTLRAERPVSVLEVHGADDPIVLYDGGLAVAENRGAPYPSVEATVAQSAAKDGCTGAFVRAKRGAGSTAIIRGRRPKWGDGRAARPHRRRALEDARRAHIPRATSAWSEAVLDCSSVTREREACDLTGRIKESRRSSGTELPGARPSSASPSRSASGRSGDRRRRTPRSAPARASGTR